MSREERSCRTAMLAMCTTEAEARRNTSTVRRSSALRSSVMCGVAPTSAGTGIVVSATPPSAGAVANGASTHGGPRGGMTPLPVTYPNGMASTTMTTVLARMPERLHRSFDSNVETHVEIVDPESVERPLDDGPGTHPGRDRDLDHPVGRDRALPSAGRAPISHARPVRLHSTQRWTTGTPR